jgi:hypothetical protein
MLDEARAQVFVRQWRDVEKLTVAIPDDGMSD